MVSFPIPPLSEKELNENILILLVKCVCTGIANIQINVHPYYECLHPVFKKTKSFHISS